VAKVAWALDYSTLLSAAAASVEKRRIGMRSLHGASEYSPALDSRLIKGEATIGRWQWEMQYTAVPDIKYQIGECC
jgi:hypothetical protein